MTSAAVKGYIPTLDGLRAIAILLVLLSHVIDRENNSGIAELGQAGVMIFFALSGYLITTRLLEEIEISGAVSLRDFYIRRVFRILPPAMVYLGLLSVLTAAGIVVCTGSAIRSALFFYTNYIDVGDIGWRAGHFWSLSVEEHFYLIWPFVLIACGVLRGWKTAAAGAVVISIWRVADSHFDIVSGLLHLPYLQRYEYRTDLIADTLLWGCCLAYFRPRVGAWASTTIALGSTIFFVCLILQIHIPGTPNNVDYLTAIRHMLPTMILAAIVSCPTAPIGRFLELAPLRFFGHLSYSLYIWQQLFLGGPGAKLPAPMGLAATFVAAYLSYRFIEKPSIRFGRRFVKKRAINSLKSDERSVILGKTDKRAGGGTPGI